MKVLVVYSTLTGNTRMIAEAIAASVPDCTLLPVQKAPSSAEGYDVVLCGFWADRGRPDARTTKWVQGLSNTRIAYFGTLGAYPWSAHARKCMDRAEELIKEPARGNTVLGSWMCQGKIAQKILDEMAKIPPEVYPMTPERRVKIEEAGKHPSEIDCRHAQEFARGILASVVL